MTRIILRREKQVSLNNTPYTREGIRNVARIMGIKRGRDTTDTLRNLALGGIIFDKQLQMFRLT